MAKKTNVVGDWDDPTIDGHPLLGPAEVAKWFKAQGCSADEQGSLAIAQLLNQYDFEGFYWRLTPEQQKRQRRTPYWQRNRRIADALATLRADLPIIIDAEVKIFPDGQTEGFHSLSELRDLVDELIPRFKRFESRRGPPPKPWHIIARKVGVLILQTWKKSTKRPGGLGKATSRPVKITKNALAYLDIKVTSEAIVEALRKKRRRNRVRKKRTRERKRVGK